MWASYAIKEQAILTIKDAEGKLDIGRYEVENLTSHGTRWVPFCAVGHIFHALGGKAGNDCAQNIMPMTGLTMNEVGDITTINDNSNPEDRTRKVLEVLHAIPVEGE